MASEMSNAQACLLLGINSKSGEVDVKVVKEAVETKLEAIEVKRKCVRSLWKSVNCTLSEKERLKRIQKRLNNKETAVLEAARLLVVSLRIGELTNDLSWRPGVSKKPKDSKWLSVADKQQVLAIIKRLSDSASSNKKF